MITRARSAVAVLVAGAMGVGAFGSGVLGGARQHVAAAPAAAVAVASEAAEAAAVLPVSVPADAPGPKSGGLLTVIPPPPPPPVVQEAAPEADRGSTTSRRRASGRTAPPSPGAQPPAPAAEPASESGYASGLASAVNSERTSRGLNAFASSSCAAKYAYSWAEHLASTGEFAHQDVGRVMNGCNAMAAGENIARGTGPVSETVSAWMASSGHRANILDPGYTHTAVASVRAADGRIVSVQIFLTL